MLMDQQAGRDGRDGRDGLDGLGKPRESGLPEWLAKAPKTAPAVNHVVVLVQRDTSQGPLNPPSFKLGRIAQKLKGNVPDPYYCTSDTFSVNFSDGTWRKVFVDEIRDLVVLPRYVLMGKKRLCVFLHKNSLWALNQRLKSTDFNKTWRWST